MTTDRRSRPLADLGPEIIPNGSANRSAICGIRAAVDVILNQAEAPSDVNREAFYRALTTARQTENRDYHVGFRHAADFLIGELRDATHASDS